MVINSHGFFEDGLSIPAQAVLASSPITELEYWMKRAWQSTHRYVCSAPGEKLKTFLCKQNITVYRSRADGAWTSIHTAKRRVPFITEAEITPVSIKSLPAQVANGKRFLAEMKSRGICVVLTGTPTQTGQVMAVARALGKSLNLPVLIKPLDGLAGYDEVHLNRGDAERFSAAILEEFDSIVETHCTHHG